MFCVSCLARRHGFGGIYRDAMLLLKKKDVKRTCSSESLLAVFSLADAAFVSTNLCASMPMTNVV